MYLFYIDESGNRDIGHVEQERFYVLTAVGMFEGHWKRFYLDIARPKRIIISRIESEHGISLDFAVCGVPHWLDSFLEIDRCKCSGFVEWLGAEQNPTDHIAPEGQVGFCGAP